jgi:hypothetical protein
MIELYHPRLSVRRQCELVGLNRSSVYYQRACASPENLQLMRLMDEQYLKTPFYGSRRMSLAEQSRAGREPQTGPTADTADGVGGDLSPSADLPCPPKP